MQPNELKKNTMSKKMSEKVRFILPEKIIVVPLPRNFAQF